MLIQNEKDELNYAVKLAKAVQMVVDALSNSFAKWKTTNYANKEVIKSMEKTQQLVIDYIYGLLGGKIEEIVTQAAKGEEP